MTITTPRLDLPFIEAAQAQKHVTHNAALEVLDIVVQLRVQRINATVPPVSPVEGHAYALGSAPTGAWAGHDGQIASVARDGWVFVSPGTGWRVWDIQAARLMVHDDEAWQAVGLSISDIDTLPQLGLNASADGTNRLTVAAAATLFTHNGSGHQVKVNKANVSATASLLFQSGFSGRAEIGLAGSDDVSVKVSADGATWRSALTAQADTGGVTLHHFAQIVPGTAPAAPARGTVYYGDAGNVLRAWDGVAWRDLF